MKLKLKINSGYYKGSILKYPDGVKIRPTKSKIKEALFNILSRDIKGSIFLDLFSGTGSIGLEALSLGAKYVCFVENDRNCVLAIQENLNKLKISENLYQVFSRDIFFYLKSKVNIFNYIYVDPPYQYDYKNLFFELNKWQIPSNISPLFILEHSENIENFPGFHSLDSRSYGKTKLSFLKLGDG